jgi:cytochrome c heme-lyase
MFFEALQRKKYDAKMEDMRAIVPLHNAVNEKAWQEILAWEKGRGGDSYVPLCASFGLTY